MLAGDVLGGVGAGLTGVGVAWLLFTWAMGRVKDQPMAGGWGKFDPVKEQKAAIAIQNRVYLTVRRWLPVGLILLAAGIALIALDGILNG